MYAYWVDGGTPGQKIYKSLSENTSYRFRVENDGHIEIFRFYFNGDSSPFKYSPTMNFNTGFPIGNSERYNNCDSLWTHMYDLSYQIADGSWSSSWGNWACWGNTSNGWYLHKDSDSELHVTNNSSGKLC